MSEESLSSEPDVLHDSQPFFQPFSQKMFQNYSLKWKGFEKCICSGLAQFHCSEDLTDVTIACEGQLFKSHKVILAMHSPFFKKIFMEIPNNHSIIYANGIKANDLRRVLAFIYLGEVQMDYYDIDGFLKTSESLNIEKISIGNVQISPQNDAQKSIADDDEYPENKANSEVKNNSSISAKENYVKALGSSEQPPADSDNQVRVKNMHSNGYRKFRSLASLHKDQAEEHIIRDLSRPDPRQLSDSKQPMKASVANRPTFASGNNCSTLDFSIKKRQKRNLNINSDKTEEKLIPETLISSCKTVSSQSKTTNGEDSDSSSPKTNYVKSWGSTSSLTKPKNSLCVQEADNIQESVMMKKTRTSLAQDDSPIILDVKDDELSKKPELLATDLTNRNPPNQQVVNIRHRCLKHKLKFWKEKAEQECYGTDAVSKNSVNESNIETSNHFSGPGSIRETNGSIEKSQSCSPFQDEQVMNLSKNVQPQNLFLPALHPQMMNPKAQNFRPTATFMAWNDKSSGLFPFLDQGYRQSCQARVDLQPYNHQQSNQHQVFPMNFLYEPTKDLYDRLSPAKPYHPKPKTKAIRSSQVPPSSRYTAHQVDEMVEQVQNFPGNIVPCAVCRKFVKRERLRAHIHECHLLHGEKILCPHCGIGLKSKGSFRVHIWRHKRGTLSSRPIPR